MRSVTGATCKSEKQADDANKKDSKRHTEESSKNRHDIDSSDESRSEGSLGEAGEKVPKMNSKQPSKNKDKDVRIAPNSTTYSQPSVTYPRIRPSSKREIYQSKVKRELAIGAQGEHRRREVDLQRIHPNLKSLQEVQRKKDRENTAASLDLMKLVKKAKSAGGHLQVQIKDTKDVDLLVKVLTENPSIRSLKHDCDFGGRSSQALFSCREEVNKRLILSGKPVESTDLPDCDALTCILDACKHVEALDLKGCRLCDQCWRILASKLSRASELRRIEIGGGDYMSSLVRWEITSWITSDSSSVRELIIDGLYLYRFALKWFWESLRKNKNFSCIKLQNIHEIDTGTFGLGIGDLFTLCDNNPNLKVLSMANTQLMQRVFDSDGLYDRYFEGWGTSPSGIAFKKHSALRILDLSNCRMDRRTMGDVAAACDGHASLIEICIEGNDILNSDLAKIEATTTRNRERLIAQASAAFDLLVSHGAGEIDVWPRELSGVLAQNTPSDILLDIAAVIDPAVAPPAQGRGSAPTATRVPKTSSSSSSSTQSSKKQ